MKYNNNQMKLLKTLAHKIWSNGEIKKGNGYFTPESNVYGATHYSRLWEKRGKSVKIILYSASDYDIIDYDNLKLIDEIILNVF